MNHLKIAAMATSAVCCFFLISGCGTYIGRSKQGRFFTYDEKVPRCYPATYVDGALIGESFEKKNRDISVGGRCAACLGGVIDLPLSLVIDTLVLPYDLCKSSETNQPSNALQPTTTTPSDSTKP
jgi:uncharacterized protein YceK